MPTKYDEAVIALYRAPLDKFVAERKRLASELKGGGDKAGGARLAALPRPPISAWTVNQLWFEARDAFDELFAAGERLRSGDLSASHAHRDALVQMRVHAEKVLAEGGHAATEATFRRIMTNLSALAAVGSFDPDPPGALSGDREPPGFDVVGMVASEGERRATGPAALPKASERARPKVDKDKDKEKEARARQERERLEQERRKKEEEERERKRVEQKRLEDALRKAKADLAKNAEEAKSLREQLAVAEKRAEQGRAEIADIESKLRGLN